MSHVRVLDKPGIITALSHGLTFVSDSEINQRLLKKYGRHCYLYTRDAYNTATLQDMIDEWSDYTNKLYQTTLYEYNPIENYDRNEQWSDTRTDNLTDSGTRTDNLSEDTTRTDNLAHNSQHTENIASSNTMTQTPNAWAEEVYNSGYNSTTQTPTEKTLHTGTYTTGNQSTTATTTPTTTTIADTGTQTIQKDNTGTQTDVTQHTGTQGNEHTGRVHGNIGVTTTQQMIEEERRIILDCTDFYLAKFADCFNLDIQDLLKSVLEEDEEEET